MSFLRLCRSLRSYLFRWCVRYFFVSFVPSVFMISLFRVFFDSSLVDSLFASFVRSLVARALCLLSFLISFIISLFLYSFHC